ncbi:MAG: hypothetical protein IJG53_05550 [Eggerthellaceae bacterium]|nr:hypothetical protein [Eggerthellaceae bacterium]
MAQGTIAGGVARGIFAAKVEVVRCPRCGAVWAKRRHPSLLGQPCPGCHGHKRLIPRR